MSTVFTTTGTFKTTCCIRCGVEFGMPASFYSERLNDHVDFYCPNGHPQHFIDQTEAERMRVQRDAARNAQVAIQARLDQVREECNAAERKAAAARGQVTKIKNRVGHGVCPCCNRTFQQLARHMASQHPGFNETDEAK